MLALIAPTAPANAETGYHRINQETITAVAVDSATATEPIPNTLNGSLATNWHTNERTAKKSEVIDAPNPLRSRRTPSACPTAP